MGGMTLDRALTVTSRLVTRIHDSIGPHFTHEESLGRFKELSNSPEAKRLPGWARRELHVVFRERVESAYRYGALRWALWRNPDTGVFVGSWLDLPDDICEKFYRNEGWGWHYWVETGRFFAGKEFKIERP